MFMCGKFLMRILFHFGNLTWQIIVEKVAF